MWIVAQNRSGENAKQIGEKPCQREWRAIEVEPNEGQTANLQATRQRIENAVEVDIGIVTQKHQRWLRPLGGAVHHR